MTNIFKILIVEDEMLIAAKISLQLSNLGYEVTGILSRGEEVLMSIENERPHVILLDINLKGKIDGIETALLIKKDFKIPIIFLTANSDNEHFERAKVAQPEAFISKPFKKLDLERAIKLVTSKLNFSDNQISEVKINRAEVLEDRIFIRQKDQLIKLFLHDILFIEADRNYCKIHLIDKQYTIVMTLKEIDTKLNNSDFFRIHRSYLINVSHVDKVGNGHLTIRRKVLPVSKSYKENLIKRLQTF